MDYEQKYYDLLYEINKLKQENQLLKEELEEINQCRTTKNVDLQKYILNAIKKFKEQ